MKADKQKAVLYLRVSTDDKGQNPERQRDLLLEWCDQHGVQPVEAIQDVGTSATKTNPFERPAFMDALHAAKEAAAVLLVEKHDRFTRQGSHEYGWAITELRRHHGVELWIAAKGGIQDQDREMVGAITDAIEAETAHKWAKDHGKRVSSGMATAQRAGQHMGRPRKELTVQEFQKALVLRAEGKGVRAIASQINADRGLFQRADVKQALRKHGVGKSLVADYLTGRRVVS